MQLKPGDAVRRTHTAPNAWHAAVGDIGTVIRLQGDCVGVFLWRARKDVWWNRSYVEKVDAA